MGRKAEVVRLIARNAEKLSARPDKTGEELLSLGMQMPVSWMKSPEHISLCIDQNGLNFVQAADFAGWVLTLSPFVDKVDVDDKITFSELKQADERVRTQFIAVNRINYILHDAMLDVYDLLEREKRMKFAVRKCRGKAEDCWGEHFAARRKQTKETAWYTVQDVLDLYCVRLKPCLEKVYESIRDYMIRQGLGDVELRARCAVVMFMGQVVQHRSLAACKVGCFRLHADVARRGCDGRDRHARPRAQPEGHEGLRGSHCRGGARARGAEA